MVRGDRDWAYVAADPIDRDVHPPDAVVLVALDRPDQPGRSVDLHHHADVALPLVRDEIARRSPVGPVAVPSGPGAEVPDLDRDGVTAVGGLEVARALEGIEACPSPGPGDEGGTPCVANAVRGDLTPAVPVSGDVVTGPFGDPAGELPVDQAEGLLPLAPGSFISFPVGDQRADRGADRGGGG